MGYDLCMRLIILLLVTTFLYGCAGTSNNKYWIKATTDSSLCNTVNLYSGKDKDEYQKEVERRQLDCSIVIAKAVKNQKLRWSYQSDLELCNSDYFMANWDPQTITGKAKIETKQERQLDCEKVIIAEEKRLAEEKENEITRLAALEDAELCDEALTSDGEWKDGSSFPALTDRSLKNYSRIDKQDLCALATQYHFEYSQLYWSLDQNAVAEAKRRGLEPRHCKVYLDNSLAQPNINLLAQTNKKENLILGEVNNRGLEHLTCQHLTGKYTPEMIAKFAKIETCNELGFIDGTPDMNMCLLQLVTQEKTDQLIAATESAEAASRDAEAAAKRAEAKQKEILERVKNAERSASSAAYSAGVLSSDYYLKKSQCMLGSDWMNC